MAAVETVKVVWPAKFKGREVFINKADFTEGTHFLPGQAPVAAAPAPKSAGDKK